MRFAVYSYKEGWLVDTCAGGRFSRNVDDATWFDSEPDAVNGLVAADLVERDRLDIALAFEFKILRVK